MFVGNYPEDFTIVPIPFSTHAAAGGAVAPASAFEVADFKIYKNGSDTEKTTTNGLTISSPFDGITGAHQLLIDTSNDTGDSGFWVAGAVYTVWLAPDETVDGQAVVKCVGIFTLGMGVNLTHWKGSTSPVDRLERSANSIVRGTVGAASSTTSIVTSSLDPAAADTDQFKGRVVIFDKDTATAELRGQATDITSSTDDGILTVSVLTTAPASGDTFCIL